VLALACGLALAAAVLRWSWRKPWTTRGGDHLLPLLLVIGALSYSFVSLPHDAYRYEGEDVGYAELLSERYGPSDPSEHPPVVRKMSRIHLAAVLVWQGIVSPLAQGDSAASDGKEVAPHRVQDSGQQLFYEPTAPDPPYGWRLTGLALWALAAWFLYGIARSWGAWRSTATAGVGLALTGPAVLFHANCLSDHLAAAVVIVLGLHLQLRRNAEQRLFSRAALLEGVVIVGAAFYTRWTSLFLLGPLILLRLGSTEASVKKRGVHSALLTVGAAVVVLPELPRIFAASAFTVGNMFSSYPAEPGLGLLSARHLLANLRPDVLGAFIEPAGHPAFLILTGLGVAALWRKPPPGGRMTLGIIIATLACVIGLCFTHIHPGSRWLLALSLWLALPLALGLQSLLTLQGRWTHAGRGAAAILLVGAGLGSADGLRDLNEGWFAEAPPAYERAREDLPELPEGDLANTLEAWGNARPLNVIANPTHPWALAAEGHDATHPTRHFTPPVIPWSSAFEERPTLYLIGSGEFSWSTSFQRDYRSQLENLFDHQPLFITGDHIAVLLTSGGSQTEAPPVFRLPSDPAAHGRPR